MHLTALCLTFWYRGAGGIAPCVGVSPPHPHFIQVKYAVYTKISDEGVFVNVRDSIGMPKLTNKVKYRSPKSGPRLPRVL